MTRLMNIDTAKYIPEETAVIILGDTGINFYLNKTDKKNKKAINNTGFTIYCVRGNHEERPENLDSMDLYYDPEVSGEVWAEEEFPNIKYFIDGAIYRINGHRVLTIGGAYSVDKYFRIGKFPKESTWTGWFKDEQLTEEERNIISAYTKDQSYDIVLTHTCPYSWQPTDLFLSSIDQSSVDNTMELWLEDLKNNMNWGIWLFGHYHCDRVERPRVEMFFTEIEDLESIWCRWMSGNELEWWITKSPNYEEDN